MYNTFGNIFKVHTFGESHGVALGAVIDGCPAGVDFDMELLKKHLAKRKPGQSKISTPRKEEDSPEVLSGIFEGKTTGAPIAIIIRNKDERPKDYSELKDVYRPGHADYTFESKYGLRDHRGGGRSSARTTVSMVIGGAIACMMLKKISSIKVASYVSSVHQIHLTKKITYQEVMDMDNELNCPDNEIASKMRAAILNAKEAGDSLGGTVSTIIKDIPASLGEPQANKLQAMFAHAMLSINAVKGFEYGLGFYSAKLKGSELNDPILKKSTKGISTLTNKSGGILGGISNGEEIYFNIAFKPTSTIFKEQDTINKEGKAIKLSAQGRHDPCVVPRASSIVEAMSWLVLADAWLMNRNSTI